MKNYTSKEIKSLDGVEAVRLRPGMYIGSTDTNGLHHLLLEVISNSIDEYLNGYGNRIEVKIDKKKNEASVRDYGRGIPFGKTDKGQEAMVEIATNLHSGGKFGQGGYSVSGGLHGIGLTAVNALSEYFEMKSYRKQETGYLKSKKGLDIEFFVIENTLKKKNGTDIVFSPDKDIFKNAKFDIAKVEKMVKELSFLTAGLEFFVNGKRFFSKDGLKDMILDRVKDPITSPVYIEGEHEGFQVEVAFQFETHSSEKIYAFTNNIPNADGGTHITGFKTAFTNSINKLAKQYELVDKKDENLNGDTLRKGLTAAVSIKMAKAPEFQGQTKEKLTTAEARGAVSKVVNEYFEKAITKKDLKQIVEKALIEQRAEEAAKRSRAAAKRMASGGKNMKAVKDLPSKLTDCKSREGELWILEGDSAGGSAKNARDTETQAILPLRGKILNTHDRELADIIKNKEVKDIITALGAGIADQFNIHNLRYSKIIILSDADSDGGHINILLLTLFLKHMPKLIEKGKVYMAVPPLYRVKTAKSEKYFYSDEELEKNKTKGEVTRFKGIGEMSHEQLWDTTMNPENRKLIQLTTDNLKETLNLFETLMGKSSDARKEFINSHVLSAAEDDFFGDEVME
ncbi:MAG: toprim domain-containing protein [archaeon]